MNSNVKLWLTVAAVLAVAGVAGIVFCHVVYWLALIGAIVVLAAIVAVVLYTRRGVEKIEDKIDR